jgi:hypothetical protein
VRAPDLQVVHQANGVAGDALRPVGLRIGRLVTLAVAARIGGDDPVAGPGQQLVPAGGLPVEAPVGGKAVQQQDGLALAEVVVGDPETFRVEVLGHEGLPSRKARRRRRPRKRGKPTGSCNH